MSLWILSSADVICLVCLCVSSYMYVSPSLNTLCPLPPSASRPPPSRLPLHAATAVRYHLGWLGQLSQRLRARLVRHE